MRTLAVLALVAIIVAPVLAGEGSPSEPPVFAPVPDPGPSVRPSVPPSLGVIVDGDLGVPPVRPVRPIVPVPTPAVRTVARNVDSGSVPGGVDGSAGASVRGVASWYCGNGSPCTRGYPGGLYAAAGPALRVGDWRGRVVVVSAGSARVQVRLIDWCACPSRVLDLYSDAFRRLAPLSAGLVKVTVTW